MTLLHPGILLGLALVSLPVIVHLLMRQKPKKLVFPALRLLQHRRKQNSRRMRLRHIWLLLLRMAAIALLVFAISRPTLPAANFGLIAREWITLLGVIAVAVGVYAVMLFRWRRRLPGYVYATRRSALRGWTTGATLLALLLLVGWPYQRRVAAEMTAPAPDARIDVPVAAVCLFDTSLSMGYQQEGQTRLAVACQIAREHIGALPDGSRIAIADDASDNPIVFQSTLGSALARIDDLEVHAATLPLNDRLRTALQAQGDDRKQQLNDQSDVAADARLDRYARRVYVFTDLAQSAWRRGGSLQREVEQLATVPIFLVDVGELQPQNAAVTKVGLSRQRISKGGTLLVGATVASIGLPPGERIVEMTLIDAGGNRLGPDRRPVSLESGAPQRIEFGSVSALKGPVVQGEVRLVSSDPLTADDVRYFTAEVGDPPRVLVIAPTRSEAQFWMVTLNPSEEPRFEVVYSKPAAIGQSDLESFDVVCLINVPHPTDDDWRRLARYVDGGGGLAVFLGTLDEGYQFDYERATAQSFLPALPDVHSVKGDWRLTLDGIDHPVFAKVRAYADHGSRAVLENELEIQRYWKVQPTADATVLARYTDEEGSPALLMRNHGQGRVLMFTTAIDAKPFTRRWNTLPYLATRWPWLALAQPMVDYLARISDSNFTVDAGEAVTIPLATDEPVLLRRPNLTQTSRAPKPGSNRLIVDDASLVGHYTLAKAGVTESIAGFSVNPPGGESDFTRLEESQLDELFGKERYQVARNIDELKSDVNLADLGKEVFSVLMALVIIAFCGEHLVANRFYESEQEAGSEGKASGFRNRESGNRGSAASARREVTASG